MLFNPLHLVSVQGFAAASYTLTTNDWETIGCAIALTPGRWLILGEIRCVVTCSTGAGYMSHRLFNTTAGTAVTNSEVLGTVAGNTTVPWQPGTAALVTVVTVSVNTTINLQSRTPAGFTYTARDVYSDADGRTSLTAIYLGSS